MKKFFFFAAAIAAAMTVNAKVITFADIVDNSSAEAAKSSLEASFDFNNIEVKGVANSAGDSYLCEVYQVDATTDWTMTEMFLKGEAQVHFVCKDNNPNKLVIKAYKEYIQPNGKAVCLVIQDLKAGDKVKINLKKALNKESYIEGATVSTHNFDSDVVELTANADEIRVYSKNEAGSADAKWQIVSVEVPGGDQAVDNVESGVKVEKFYRDGQLIIRKNGVEYNALGAQL